MDISFNLRSLRRSIAGLSMLALLATMSFAGIANAQTFSDTSADDWWYEAVESLVDQGVIANDVSDYRPGDTLNRAEAITLVVMAYAEVGDYGVADYSDVSEDDWFYPYVDTGTALGIVSGYDDSDLYGPGDDVTRAAFAKMIVTAAGLETDLTDAPHFSDSSEGDWHYDYVETGYNNSVFDGYDDGSFGVGDSITRAAAAVMTSNGQSPELRYTVSEAETCDDGYTWDTDTLACVEDVVTTSAATLTVEMGDVIDGTTVPKGATSVDLLNVTFTANGDAAELDGFTLHRTGVGSYNDFSYVYLYDGATRLTTGRTFASDDNETTFGSLNYELADGESVTFTVVADFASSATTGDENAVEITSADKVDTNAEEVTGTFSMTSGTFSMSGASAGTATIAKTGSVANPTVGDQDAEIAQFKISASSSEDMAFQRITLTVKGTASNDTYSNLQLVQSGDVIATAESVSADDIVTFVIDGTYGCDDYGYEEDGFCIGKGNSKTFSVYSDIGTAADANDTIITYLDESTDLEVEGLVYGYGSQVTYTSYDNGTPGTDSNSSTIQGGQFTMSQDGPTTTDIAVNGKDVILNRMTFTSERNVEVKSLSATIVATGSGLISDDASTANFSDFKLVRLDDNGDVVETLMGPMELSTSGNDSSQSISWTNTWNMDEGESMSVAITADIANITNLDGTTIYAELDAISTTDGIRDRDTNEYVTDIVPSVAVTGNTMTVKAASVAVALASSANSDTYVQGTSDVELGVFTVTVGSAMDVNIDQIVVAGYMDEDGGSTFVQGVDNSVYFRNIVTSAYVTDSAGTQLGSTESFSTGGNVTFNNLDWDIAAGTTEVLYVYGDISSSAPYNDTNETIYVDIDDVTTDMSVTDTEGNTITATGSAANTGSMVLTVSGGGTLAIAEDSGDPTENQIVAAGDTDVLVGRFKLTATDEEFDISSLTFTATGTVNGAVGTTPGDYLDNIDALTLKYATDMNDLNTLDAEYSVTMGGTNAVFTGFGSGDYSALVVPQDESVYLELYADFANHTREGGSADSDDGVKFILNTGDTDGETNGDFEAVGQGSGTAYTEDELSDVTLSNTTYVYRTIPTIANDTSLGSSLVTGADQKVYQFTVSSSSTEELMLMYMTLDVSPTGLVTGQSASSLTSATGDNVDVGSNLCGTRTGISSSNSVEDAPWYITEEGKSTKVGSGCYDSDANQAKFEMNIASGGTSRNSGTIISAGGSKTFTVYANLYEDSDTSTTAAISVKIHNDSSYTAAQAYQGTTTGYADTNNAAYTETQAATGLIWTDKPFADTVNGELTTGYMTGYEVPGMPVSYMTLSK